MFTLLRIRDFGLLWLAGLISFAGDAALLIALPLHVYQLTDSTLATAIALAARFVPRVLFAPVAGVFVDRWDRKKTMVFTDLARGAILLPILAAPDTLAVVYSVMVFHGAIGLFFAPAEGALLPKLVGKEHLVAANALNSLNNSFGMLIGPVAGAFLYAQSGIGGVIIVDSATYLLSSLLISLIVADARPEIDPDAPSGGAAWTRMVADLRAGIGVVQHNLSLRVLFISFVLAGVAEGVFLTLGLAPLVLDVLGGTSAQVGWVASAQAVGGMVAALVVVRIGHRMTKRWLLGGGLIGVGLADLGTANAHRVAGTGTAAVSVAMGSMVLAGPPSVAGGAGMQSIIQEQTSDAYRGRVFGAFSSTTSVSMLVGFAAGGILGDMIGLVPVLSAAALIRVVGGLLVFVLLPRHEHAQQVAVVGVTRDA
jgi:MFS family permease